MKAFAFSMNRLFSMEEKTIEWRLHLSKSIGEIYCRRAWWMKRRTVNCVHNVPLQTSWLTDVQCRKAAGCRESDSVSDDDVASAGALTAEQAFRRIGIWSASWSVTLTRWTLQRFTCLASHLLAFSRLRGQESHDPSYEISTLPHVEVLNGGNRPGRRSKRRPNAGKMCGNLNIFTVCDQFYFAYFTHFWNIFSSVRPSIPFSMASSIRAIAAK